MIHGSGVSTGPFTQLIDGRGPARSVRLCVDPGLGSLVEALTLDLLQRIARRLVEPCWLDEAEEPTIVYE
ncbi:hypothetical protein [Amycolatopsis sp. NPDC051372]|uniref:hypothetical protein n=1 Tax=unclassified Amycolatopsis TaxID=2618356 RepID=UPI003428D83B